jgi:hypothetical protein
VVHPLTKEAFASLQQEDDMKLSERAMLVALHISSWSGSAHDREVTEEVNESFRADKKDAGRYNKRLVSQKFFQGLTAAHNHAKKVHRMLTLPWEDDGTRILTSAGYLDYTKRMHECRGQVEAEVKHFIEGLPEYIKEAQVRLGDMYNPDDYPTEDELKLKFGMDVEVKNVPDASDFRAQLSEDQTKVIVKDIERRCNVRLEKAMDDIFMRTKDLVGKMSEQLGNYKAGTNGVPTSGKFRDSMIMNIYALAELMPSLNVTGDKRIDELQKQLLSDLTSYSPEELRADAKKRQQAKQKADKILKKVEQYLK